jgi:nicotinate-nucleotide adenylyltransferase
MKIGLFFGTYNPIHIGHLAIANFIAEYSDLRQIWFVVSPHNPHKLKENLLDDYHRLEMVHLGIEDDPRFRICDVEFRMPKPSYTMDTMVYLTEKYPMHEFAIIMGSDNLRSFHKWKNHDTLEKNFTRYVYPRYGDDPEDILKYKNIQLINAPRMEISSSLIREAIKTGKDMRFFLPLKVYKYIKEMNFYKV